MLLLGSDGLLMRTKILLPLLFLAVVGCVAYLYFRDPYPRIPLKVPFSTVEPYVGRARKVYTEGDVRRFYYSRAILGGLRYEYLIVDVNATGTIVAVSRDDL